MTKRPVDNDPFDVAQRLEEALEDANISQYELAKRLAKLRDTHLGSQDQAVRRIRRLGQLPTQEVAADLARAFDPELDLPDDWFFQPRTSGNLREATEQALAQIEELQRRVASLEKALGRRASAAQAKPGSRTRRTGSR